MSQIGNTEALEKYLQLEHENKELSKTLAIYKEELEKRRKAYSTQASYIAELFEWLTQFENRTLFVKRKMAKIFKYAYMENEFEDMRAEWPINKNAVLDISNKPQGEKQEWVEKQTNDVLFVVQNFAQ